MVPGFHFGIVKRSLSHAGIRFWGGKGRGLLAILGRMSVCKFHRGMPREAKDSKAFAKTSEGGVAKKGKITNNRSQTQRQARNNTPDILEPASCRTLGLFSPTIMSSHPSPGPSTQPLSSRHKQKPHTVGIAAGAEDAKYQAKYKDLKRKVKEIETVSRASVPLDYTSHSPLLGQ